MSGHAIPLVQDRTFPTGESVQTVLSRLVGGRWEIPNYQRDADQWDLRKKSLFIESVLNNLTVPAFFLCENAHGKTEVIDGQQRLTTLRQYFQDEFAISDSEDIDYLTPQSVQYKGKKFSSLPQKLKDGFNDYILSIINLPKNMDLSTKLEVFRRINEGGIALTGQDIRLAYYSESKAVTLIKIAGRRDSSSESATRILQTAGQMGLPDLWASHPETFEIWADWWEGKERARGQNPSLMFLWYLVTLDFDILDDLVKNCPHLRITFRDTIEEALDICCAQLRYQEFEQNSPVILPNEEAVLTERFRIFAVWFQAILGAKIPGLSVDKFRQAAIFIGAAARKNVLPTAFTKDVQWAAVGRFLRTPRDSGRELLGDVEGYPEPKGRWVGPKGQRAQCEKAGEIIDKILAL